MRNLVFFQKLFQLRMPLLHAEDKSGPSAGHIISHIQKKYTGWWARIFERHRRRQIIATLDELPYNIRTGNKRVFGEKNLFRLWNRNSVELKPPIFKGEVRLVVSAPAVRRIIFVIVISTNNKHNQLRPILV